MIIDTKFGVDYKVICAKKEERPKTTEIHLDIQPPSVEDIEPLDTETTLRDLRWAYAHVAKGDKVDMSIAPSAGAKFWYRFGLEYPIKFADIVSKYLLPKELEADADKDIRFKDDGRTIDLAKSLLEKLAE